MNYGRFVGKAACVEQVREFCIQFRLDADASRKLEGVMVQREAMGKDVKRDLECLATYLENSNKPSALVSMKLASLGNGDSIGPCAHARKKAEQQQKGFGAVRKFRGRSRSRGDEPKSRGGRDDSREPSPQKKPNRRPVHRSLII